MPFKSMLPTLMLILALLVVNLVNIHASCCGESKVKKQTKNGHGKQYKPVRRGSVLAPKRLQNSKLMSNQQPKQLEEQSKMSFSPILRTNVNIDSKFKHEPCDESDKKLFDKFESMARCWSLSYLHSQIFSLFAEMRDSQFNYNCYRSNDETKTTLLHSLLEKPAINIPDLFMKFVEVWTEKGDSIDIQLYPMNDEIGANIWDLAIQNNQENTKVYLRSHVLRRRRISFADAQGDTDQSSANENKMPFAPPPLNLNLVEKIRRQEMESYQSQ